MQQMLCSGIVLIFLLLCTWQDIRDRKLSTNLLLLFIGTGVVWNVIFPESWLFLIEGMLPGLGTLLFGKLSKEQIGFGDGFVLTAMGLFLGGKEVAGLLLGAFFLCALAAVALFFLGKLRRGMAIPFLPFLVVAYAAELLTAL